MKKILSLIVILIVSCAELKSSEVQSSPFGAEITQEDFNLIFPDDNEYTVTPIDGGFSGAKIYKVDVRGKEYVVRRSAGMFGYDQIVQEFAIQEIAAREGISPKVIYSNPQRGLVAMEMIANKLDENWSYDSFKNIPNAFLELVRLIRTLHETENVDPVIKEWLVRHVNSNDMSY